MCLLGNRQIARLSPVVLPYSFPVFQNMTRPRLFSRVDSIVHRACQKKNLRYVWLWHMGSRESSLPYRLGLFQVETPFWKDILHDAITQKPVDIISLTDRLGSWGS